jgi:uncharacterized membrane protein YoaK (UPF0700 family)
VPFGAGQAVRARTLARCGTHNGPQLRIDHWVRPEFQTLSVQGRRAVRADRRASDCAVLPTAAVRRSLSSRSAETAAAHCPAKPTFMRTPSPPSSPQERLTPVDFGLALLALASGTSDAISFLTLGNVFTSAMTGNTALLGIAIGQGRVSDALLGLLALAGFVVGAATAAAISESRGEVALARVLRPLFAFEATYLGCFAIVWTLGRSPPVGSQLFGLIVLSAAAMGIQCVAARRLNAPGINTIVFTSTLVSIITSITATMVSRTRPRIDFVTRRQIGSFVTYAIGAIVAGALTRFELSFVALLPLLSVLGAIACCELGARKQNKDQ